MATPTGLTSGTTGGTVASLTTSAFTPRANTTLYVYAGCQGTAGGTFTITDSVGLTWTQETVTLGFDMEPRLWSAPVGSSPVSMTVTLDPLNTVFIGYAVFDIEDTATLVTGQMASAAQSTGTPTPSGTLPASATSGNYTIVIHSLNDDNASGVPLPAGFTNVITTGASNFHPVRVSYSTTFTGTNVTVTQDESGLPSVGVIFELEESGGAADPTGTAAHWLLRPPGRLSPAGRLNAWRGSTGAAEAAEATPIAGDDTGSGADDGSVAASITGGDASTGADTGTVAAGLSASDTATGADSGSLAASASASDTGLGADTASLAAALGGTDAGSGTDTGSLAAGAAGTDTGSGADTASPVVSITASDTATAVDTASVVDTGATAKSGTDTATAADTATIAATEGATETSTGADSGAVSATSTASDTASAVDSAFVTVVITGTDSASAADLASLAVAVAAAELATALESASYTDTGLVITDPGPLVAYTAREPRLAHTAPEDRVAYVPRESTTAGGD